MKKNNKKHTSISKLSNSGLAPRFGVAASKLGIALGRRKWPALTVLLAFLLLSGTARAEWTPEQKTLGYAALALHVIDYRQTSQLPKLYNEGYREANPLFGSAHPSRSEINRNFAIATLAGAALTFGIPERHRTGFLRAMVTVKLIGVAHNQYVGVDIKF